MPIFITNKEKSMPGMVAPVYNPSTQEVQMTKNHMKKCSPSLTIREMQIKTTLRLHLSPVRIAAIKNTNNHNYWQGCGKKEPSNTADGNVS
jgi:hypothetical protein